MFSLLVSFDVFIAINSSVSCVNTAPQFGLHSQIPGTPFSFTRVKYAPLMSLIPLLQSLQV